MAGTSHRRLTKDVTAWVADAVAPGARFVRGRRLTGGITSSMHALTIRMPTGQRHNVVLRRWVGTERDGPRLVRNEAEVLDALGTTTLPAPRLVATDPLGEHTGYPALLMTRLPGRMDLAPSDPERWLAQIARLLPAVHNAPVQVRPFEWWIDTQKLTVPDWSGEPEAWKTAIAAAQEDPPTFEPCFIHRDYQHFNMLWSRGKLVGLVDWSFSSMGPRDLDVGHCRLNLAVLFSADLAERFRLAYEAEAGRSVDPYWDIVSILSFSSEWKRFIPLQVGNRAHLDLDGMYSRVDTLMTGAVARL